MPPAAVPPPLPSFSPPPLLGAAAAAAATLPSSSSSQPWMNITETKTQQENIVMQNDEIMMVMMNRTSKAIVEGNVEGPTLAFCRSSNAASLILSSSAAALSPTWNPHSRQLTKGKGEERSQKGQTTHTHTRTRTAHPRRSRASCPVSSGIGERWRVPVWQKYISFAVSFDVLMCVIGTATSSTSQQRNKYTVSEKAAG